MAPSASFNLLLLLASRCTLAYHPEAFDYVLETIAYYVTIDRGVFSCFFYDLAPVRPFADDSMMGQLIRSPALDNVVKLVYNGTQMDDSNLGAIYEKQSMVVIDPGASAWRLERSGILVEENALAGLFDPATKILVLVDGRKPKIIELLLDVLRKIWRYNKVAVIDCTGKSIMLSNVGQYWHMNGYIHPEYLFKLIQHNLASRNITYYSDRNIVYSTDPDVLWIKEVARYLNTKAVQYKHGCEPGKTFVQCMSKQEAYLKRVDIQIDSSEWDMGFNIIFTTYPVVTRILVPRDRQLNAAELFILPFRWEVWLLLLVVLTLAESLKHFFPNHFQNDPILLVVCGFERHNLHETGRYEKMILHSLIILMFFASNAFETRIISLMISKPSLQRVKTVQDLETYGIKFYADLDRYPYLVKHPTIGKYVIHGHQKFWDTIPGIGMYADELTAKVAPAVVFDYKRNLPWYVALDYRSLDGFQLFHTSFRNPLLQEFQQIRLLLTEAGIYAHWEQRNVRTVIQMLSGRRLRENMDGKVYLNMDDILPAWMILGIGCGIALIAFLGELVQNKVNARDLVVLVGMKIGMLWTYCKSLNVKIGFLKNFKFSKKRVAKAFQNKVK